MQYFQQSFFFIRLTSSPTVPFIDCLPDAPSSHTQMCPESGVINVSKKSRVIFDDRGVSKWLIFPNFFYIYSYYTAVYPQRGPLPLSDDLYKKR